MSIALWRKNLRKLRKLQGKSQADIALQLNTSQQAIANWENLEKEIGSPDIDQMEVITNYLGVSIDDFIKKDFTNAPLNTNILGKENDYKSTPNRTPIRTPKSEKQPKEPIIEEEKPVYQTGPAPDWYWRNKYIALLEQKAQEKPIAYVDTKTFEDYSTRLLAIQEIVLKLASHVHHSAIDDERVALSTMEKELMTLSKTGIPADGHT